MIPLLGQTGLTTGVELDKQLPEKGLVGVPIGKVAISAQQQGLLHGLLESVMSLLDVAVFMGAGHLDGVSFQPVVLQ